MHIFEFIAVAQIQRGQNLFEVAIAFLKTCDYTRVLKYVKLPYMLFLTETQWSCGIEHGGGIDVAATTVGVLPTKIYWGSHVVLAIQEVTKTMWMTM